MKFSAFSVSMPLWSPAELVELLAAQGWDGVEWRVIDQEGAAEPGFWKGNLSTWPLTGLAEHATEIGRLTRAAGLVPSGLNGYQPCHARERVETLLAATAAAGAGRVRIQPPNLDPDRHYRELFDQAREDFRWVAERAAHHGVQALVETHQGRIASSASAAMRLIGDLDPAHVGVIHDVGNLVHEGHEELRASLQILGDHLAHVHIKNAAWFPDPEPGPGGVRRWRVEWVPLREGVIDIPAYAELLRSVGYDGWVVLEDFSTAHLFGGDPEGGRERLAAWTADSLAFLRTHFGGARGAS